MSRPFLRRIDDARSLIGRDWRVELHIMGKYRHIRIGYSRDCEDHTFCIALYFFSLYISYLRGSRKDRKLELSVHNGTIWWKLWVDDNSWTEDFPRWRRSNFDPMRRFFGLHETSQREVIAEHTVIIPMPERNYVGTAKLIEMKRWRKRLPYFKTTWMQASIEIPEGIGVPGKGENSWDLDDDATFGISMRANNIEEAIGHLVGSVMRERAKYGGSEWTPKVTA